MPRHPQVKICGLTRPGQAAACVAAGADAIGLVFFPKSPRHVSVRQGAEIAAAVAGRAALVGVFVDAARKDILARAKACRLTAVQLHGQETPELVEQMRNEGLTVIKALFASRSPGFDRVGDYDPSAFLVECGKGKLPGGNARTWHWGDAAKLNSPKPVVLAGGLDPDNIAEAIAMARPDGVDLSSGVEQSPGVKDIDKVRRFISAVRNQETKSSLKTIFSNQSVK